MVGLLRVTNQKELEVEQKPRSRNVESQGGGFQVEIRNGALPNTRINGYTTRCAAIIRNVSMLYAPVL
jgi:hypothetical protein